MSEPVITTITETLAILRRLVDWNRDRDAEVDREFNLIVADAEGILERCKVSERYAPVGFGFSWLAEARDEARDEAREDLDRAIDIVYNNLDEMLTNGRFGEVDELLHYCAENCQSIPSELLLAILTLTSHAPSDSFSNRRLLVETTREILKTRGEWEPDALKGLE